MIFIYMGNAIFSNLQWIQAARMDDRSMAIKSYTKISS